MNMFESTTHFDFDDDVILDSSFTPTNSSTQASHVPKRICSDLENEGSKKLKCDDSNSVIKNLNKSVSVQKRCIDAFISPNRVVKRKFPGPAGLLPEMGANDKSILQLLENEKLKGDDVEDVPLLSQQTNSVFENSPWKEMCKDFRGGNEENLVERFNIKWIKKQALKQLLSHKAPFLAAVLQNLDIVDGKIPTINVTLKDMTGDIRGTILHSLYEEYSTYFRIGSVLVLKHFGVLSAGHNNHCLTITPNNLISIYCGEVRQKPPNDNVENICVENIVGVSVKKIVIQDCNVEEILRKYNEDIVTYSEEKRKINFGNLYRNKSEETENSLCPKDNSSSIGSSLTTPLIVPKAQRSCGIISTTAFNAMKTNNILNNLNNNSEKSSITPRNAGFHEDSVKKKFNFKKHFSSPIDINSSLTENAPFAQRSKTDGSVKTCDSVVTTSSQISVKTDKKEHAEIWKNLLEGVDTDSLFDDF